MGGENRYCFVDCVVRLKVICRMVDSVDRFYSVLFFKVVCYVRLCVDVLVCSG